MKQVLYLGLVLAVAGFLVIGPGDGSVSGADEKQSPDVQHVAAGQEFTVTLESNPSTGYLWRLGQTPDPGVVKSLGMKFESPSQRGLIGAPGKEVWTFRAEGPGQAVIYLEYIRPWEKGIPAARTHTVQVTVE
jgi:predicted secreted protein